MPYYKNFCINMRVQHHNSQPQEILISNAIDRNLGTTMVH